MRRLRRVAARGALTTSLALVALVLGLAVGKAAVPLRPHRTPAAGHARADETVQDSYFQVVQRFGCEAVDPGRPPAAMPATALVYDPEAGGLVRLPVGEVLDDPVLLGHTVAWCPR